MPEPVSPADTIRTALTFTDAHSERYALAALDALLAVGERDKAEREQAVAQTQRIIEKSTRDYNLVVEALDLEREARQQAEERGERDRQHIAQLTERVELLEVLGQQAVSTIEFLHGCLTDPGFKYLYPEQTEQRLAELRRFLPEREVCVHSKPVPGCQGCIDGQHAREVMGRARALLAGEEDAAKSERSFYPTEARLSAEAAIELAESGDFLGAALHFRMAADYLVVEIWHRDRVARAVKEAGEPARAAGGGDT